LDRHTASAEAPEARMTMLKGLRLVVRPGGFLKLGGVVALAVLQGIAQTLGVFSVAPFLGAASNPSAFRQSILGHALANWLPGASNAQILAAAGAASLAMLVLGNALTVAAEHARSRYAHDLEQQLRIGLLADLMRKPYAYFLSTSSTALLKILLDDTGAVASRLVLPAIDMVARSLLALLLVAGLVALDPWLVLAGVVALALHFAIVIVAIRRRALASSERLKRNIPALYNELMHILNGAKPIIATGTHRYFVGRAARASKAVVRSRSAAYS